MTIDKRRLLHAIERRLQQDLQVARAAADASRQGATHEGSRAEDPKDMRSTEVSYLARGQAARVQELEGTLTRLKHLELRDFDDDDAIAVSALVLAEVDGQERTYFIVPVGGGLEVQVDNTTVTLVSVTTPVGRALVGAEVGDELELKVGGGIREYAITGIS